MRFPNAMKGIKKIYIAEMLCVISALLGIAMLILLAVNHIDLQDTSSVTMDALRASGMLIPVVVYSIGTILLILISFILNLAGILQASHDEEYFKRALAAAIMGVMVSVVHTLLRNNPTVVSIMTVASTVLTMLMIMMVLGGIGRIADSLGNKEVSEQSRQCSKLVLYPFGFSLLAELAIAIFDLNESATALFSIANLLLDLGIYIIYLRVLGQARSME